jgi:hypothetical protein
MQEQQGLAGDGVGGGLHLVQGQANAPVLEVFDHGAYCWFVGRKIDKRMHCFFHSDCEVFWANLFSKNYKNTPSSM